MSCRRCGACCCEVVTPLPALLDGDALEWLRHHGGRLGQEGGVVVGLVPCRCRMLGNDDRTCLVHKRKPRVCRDYLCDEARRG